MKVNRSLFLNQLEAVQPGLSQKEFIHQSSCFVFRNGRIITFNGEIACTLDSEFVDFEGAVPATKLLGLLGKMEEKEILFTLQGKIESKELRIKGRGRTAGITLQEQILLPFEDEVDKPKKWRPLHKNFCEACLVVAACAGTDATKPVLMCVHLNPKGLESSNNYQLMHYPLRTGVKNSLLVRADILRHAVESDIREYSETKSWVHFRNAVGLVLSCRLTRGTFPNPERAFNIETEAKVHLPKALGKAMDKAELFSVENPNHNQILVLLKKNKIQVSGEGLSGWYRESRSVKYTGPSIQFLMAPKVLKDIVERHSECVIGSKKLMISTGTYRYLSVLSSVKTDDKDEEE